MITYAVMLLSPSLFCSNHVILVMIILLWKMSFCIIYIGPMVDVKE